MIKFDSNLGMLDNLKKKLIDSKTGGNVKLSGKSIVPIADSLRAEASAGGVAADVDDVEVSATTALGRSLTSNEITQVRQSFKARWKNTIISRKTSFILP